MVDGWGKGTSVEHSRCLGGGGKPTLGSDSGSVEERHDTNAEIRTKVYVVGL